MTTRQPTSCLPPGTTSQVRRALFHNSLSRRPTSASTSTSATTLHDSLPDTSSAEIVVRNPEGEYQVTVPVLAKEEGEPVGDEEQKADEELEQRIEDLFRNRNRQSSEPSELFEAVQESLRRRVAGLEDDNWMFEAEK